MSLTCDYEQIRAEFVLYAADGQGRAVGSLACYSIPLCVWQPPVLDRASGLSAAVLACEEPARMR